ncbi:MAG: ornithine cyclodeaminase family protein [Chloroflexi bacterium]|nr:ornithine cyclodeaminase family protein [Chloroflexota bacterium]
MPLYLTESDINRLLTVPIAIDLLDEVFKAQAAGKAVNVPRSRIPLDKGSYNLMSSAWHEKGVVGQKSYAAAAGGIGFHVLLYGTRGEGLMAIIEANRMGQIRTGSASGLASKYMARPESSVVAVIGSGYQARTQLEAVVSALPIKTARVYSRSPEHREGFANAATTDLEIGVSAVDSVEAAVEGADVVIVVTSASEPVLLGDHVAKGVHINAAGANGWLRRELDTQAVSAANLIVTDDVDQAKIECADLMRAVEAGRLMWQQVRPLSDVVGGAISGRAFKDDVTLFESQGVALEDIAVGEWVYRQAVEQGIGTQVGS